MYSSGLLCWICLFGFTLALQYDCKLNNCVWFPWVWLMLYMANAMPYMLLCDGVMLFIAVCLSVCVFRSAPMPDCLPVCCYVCMPVCMTACLSVCLPVWLSVCLSACLLVVLVFDGMSILDHKPALGVLDREVVVISEVFLAIPLLPMSVCLFSVHVWLSVLLSFCLSDTYNEAWMQLCIRCMTHTMNATVYQMDDTYTETWLQLYIRWMTHTINATAAILAQSNLQARH